MLITPRFFANHTSGFYTVARLAEHGAHVYMCARTPTKGHAAIEKIKGLYPNANVTLLEMDNNSLASVVAAAKLLRTKETTLHGVINNAGVMATPFEMTKDGHESQWQTNYLAHWLFTYHLLPLLRSTAKTLPPGSVRIVNLSSSGHYSAPKGGINFADLSLADQGGMTRYGQSKLANVLHAKTLHGQYGPGASGVTAEDGQIWSSTVHPGLVKTDIGNSAQLPGALLAMVDIYKSLGGGVDADTGAWTSVFCAASPQMKAEQSGTYFQRIAEPGCQSGNAKNLDLAAELEKWTLKEMEKGGWLQ